MSNTIKLKAYSNQGYGGGDITVDDSLSINSTNPVTNKAIASKFNQVDAQLALKAEASDLAGFETTKSADAKLALKADKAELEGFVTDQTVDAKVEAALAGADFVKPDALNQYETTASADEKFALKADKAELEGLAKTSDLAKFETTESVDKKLAGKADSSALSSLATKTELSQEIQGVDTKLALKADKTEIKNFITADSLTPYAKTETVNASLAEKANTADLADKLGKEDSYSELNTSNKTVLGAINEVLASGGSGVTIDPELGESDNPVANRAINAKFVEVDAALANKIEAGALTPYATKEALEQAQQSVTGALQDKADKSQLNNLATKDEIAGFITESQVTEKGYITEAALSGYEKTSDLTPKLELKADKTELTGLATKEELAEKADSSILDDYVTTVALNGKNYITRGSLDLTLQNYTKNVAVNGSIMTSTMGTGEQVTQELPFYTETEMNEKLGLKADATALANKADKSELTTLATKEEIKPFVKSVTKMGNTVTVTKGDGTSNTFDVGGGAAAGVTSINGQTGEVTLDIPTDNTQLANGAGYATTAYVDEKIGAIASQLDTINGEVM